MAAGARRRFAAAGGLYLVITEPRIPHGALVTAAVERAVPVIQLREKRLPDRELVALARVLVRATRDTETIFILNDRPDLALAVGADGVHVGRGDVAAADARRIVGGEAIVGVSANTPEEVRAAARAGADYVGVGPIYPTSTKPDARAPIGTEGLRDVAGAGGGLPTVAIGGITRASAPEVIEAGADYVAVVSAICHADDPVRALDDFLAALSERTP
jgi:thiamine-phosphate pyrophosphorylase